MIVYSLAQLVEAGLGKSGKASSSGSPLCDVLAVIITRLIRSSSDGHANKALIDVVIPTVVKLMLLR